METVIGNFLKQPNRDFPLDCDTLETLQANTALVAAIGNIAGDKVILKGCELTDNNTRRNSGYLFVRTKAYPHGEVLYWEGGIVSEGMYVKTEDIAVNAQGYDYPRAYTKRTMAPGVGSENFKWDEFVTPKPSAELNKQLAELGRRQESVETKVESAEPLGVIKMWAGKEIPTNYLLCDGAVLNAEEYPELYEAIGNTFNTCNDRNGKTPSSVQSGSFRLPDLRGRFIAGFDSLDKEYDKYGNSGGKKAHILEEKHLPPHTHEYLKSINASTRTGNKSNEKFAAYESARTGTAGGGMAHETRPPYYVLAYIIKVR